MDARRPYQLQDLSWSRISDIPSLSYDPLPQSSFSVPRKEIPKTYARSDEVSLVQGQGPGIMPIERTRQKPRFQIRLRSWIPELVASILAVISLLAIVIVLRVYDGRALGDLKLPKYLTLNGLIAAIATLERVFLVVPVGSALSQEAWLWFVNNDQESVTRSRLRDLSLSDAASRGAWGSLIVIPHSGRRLLTLCGAVIMVLSLAIGTFAQQLIIITTLPIYNESSSLQPGNIPRAEYYDNWHGNPAEDAWGPELNIKASIYNGFLTQNISAITSTCPTGNCTFPLTPSIAVCGDCVITTNAITGANTTVLNYTTSTGTVFSISNSSYGDEGTGFQVLPAYTNSTSDGNLTVVAFDMLGVGYGSTSSALAGQPGPVMNSSRCRLWMCVNVYNTSIENGIQRQDVVQSFSDIPSTESFSGADNWTFTLPERFKEVYNVSAFAVAALSTELGTLAGGSVRLDLSGYDASSDIVEAIWSGAQNRTYQDTWIKNVAMSITNTIRQDIPASQSKYNGTGYQLGIAVDWRWLILPIALVAGAILLLLVVMFRTARSRVGVWKGNPLAMLLLEADSDLRQHLREIGRSADASGVDERVGSKKATLAKTDLGSWMLKSA